ncbi:MAG: DUF4249 domain-containing protein [Bacteroidales bacterium]|nr:DUF4249 domain-containing protein [Bacteroidales bacterium]
MRKVFLYILCALLLAACQRESQPKKPQLVIEGWIESGDYPHVAITTSLPVVMGQQITTPDLVEHVAREAVVTVSDGEKTVQLEGAINLGVFPPYYFTTTQMKGEVGKTYSLRVEYQDYVATAQTTIPQPVPIEKLYVDEIKDGLATVKCGFTDPPEPGNYYKLFTKTLGEDADYVATVLGLVSDEDLNGYTELVIYASQRFMDVWGQPNVREYDVLRVKLCTMDKTSFDFWSAFDKTVLGTAFNLRVEGSAYDSIIDGAKGYWVGYGVDEVKQIKVELND